MPWSTADEQTADAAEQRPSRRRRLAPLGRHSIARAHDLADLELRVHALEAAHDEPVERAVRAHRPGLADPDEAPAAAELIAATDRLAAAHTSEGALRRELAALQDERIALLRDLATARAERDLLVTSVSRYSSSTTGRVWRRWQRLASDHPLLAMLLSAPVAWSTRLVEAIHLRPQRPNALFDATWYLARFRDARDSGLDAWVYHRRHGRARGHDPCAFFDRAWYRDRYPRVAQSGMDPEDHYLGSGGFDGLDPSPLFDSNGYLRANADVAAAGMNPLVHYLRHGWAEGRAPNPFMDPAWYMDRYPDVAASELRPFEQYLLEGGFQGRDPSPHFDSAWYLSAHPDVAAAGVNPLAHYLGQGRSEGRSVRPARDARGGTAPSLPTRPPSTWPDDDASPGAWLTQVALRLPSHARIVLAGERGRDALDLAGHRWRRLSAPPAGRPPTVPASSGRTLIAQVEAARWHGWDHLVLPPSAMAWRDRYPDLASHLDRWYRRSPIDDGACGVWSLTEPTQDHELTSVLEALRVSAGGGALSVLDWTGRARRLTGPPGIRVFAPPLPGRVLPYLDGTVDVVVVDEPDTATAREARRVAHRAVLVLGPSGVPPRVAWQRPAPDRPGVTLLVLSLPNAPVDGTFLDRLRATLPSGLPDRMVVAGDTSRLTPRWTGGRSLPAWPAQRLVPCGVGSRGPSEVLRAGLDDEPDGLDLLVIDGATWPVPGWAGGLLAGLRAAPAATGVLLLPDGRPLGATDGPTSGGATDAVPVRFLAVRPEHLRERLDAGAVTVGSGQAMTLMGPGRVEPRALALVASGAARASEGPS